jgi:DNA-binding transcriptional LysR family regulator
MCLASIQLCMGREPDWSLYRTFLAVVRERSFSAAARSIGSTQPTVGRQIEALEEALEVKLFSRSQRGLMPTAAARELVAHAETMASAATALRRISSGETDEEAGTVRLTAGEYVGLEVLPSILYEFSRDYPRIVLELSISNRNEDLLHREADIAVRMARPTQKPLVARRIGRVEIGLFAHRSYVATRGLPRTLSELSNHRRIGFDRDTHVLRTSGGVAATMGTENFDIRTDSVAAQVSLLRAGLGIGACHVNVARRERDLVPVPIKQFIFEREMWLVMHSDLRHSRRVRLLFDHLSVGLARYVGE